MKYTNDDLAVMHRTRSYAQIAADTGLTYDAVRNRVRRVKASRPKAYLPASPHPGFTQPLRMEGDALLLFDFEAPFHHADFCNRCIELAQTWQIDQCILGGDIVHFETLSAWGAAWQDVQPGRDNLTLETERRWRAKIQRLPAELQGEFLEELNSITADTLPDQEILQAQHILQALESSFDSLHYVIGNHDDRFLRKLESPMTPRKLLDFLGLTSPKWEIKPYYYSELLSGGELYRIEHPRGAGANTAVKLADKYECHVIVGHSHLQSMQWSTSGRYYAIAAGCAVDEQRLAYAAQRSSNRPAHKLGAVIVREGVPYILHDRVNWQRLSRM